MDEIRAGWVERVEVETLQQRQLLQQHRTLAPRAALDDRVAVIIVGQRRLDRRLPARHVVGGQQPAMPPARGVEHLLGAAEAFDRLGDKAAIPGVAGAVDQLFAGPATRFGLGENPAIGGREGGVAEQPAGDRRVAARQVDRRGTRPFAAEQFGDCHDRVADAADQRIAVLGIAERWLEQVGQRHRAVIAQQARPGGESAGHAPFHCQPERERKRHHPQ